MSLRAPFLVKQYLSDDIESGSYSRIFWYHPLQADKASKGGIGIFFEVLSGDVDDDIYEQITKSFWESFTNNFYIEGFEESLKKSIKAFIHLLQNYGIEEGLDVNISLFNVVESKKHYTLKLISFGDSDIFVIRKGKFADMSNMIPVNKSLYDLKFLEVELDKGDVLMLGNKTLLKNAFEADLFEMSSLGALLRSLEEFKDNLFGSKKLFIVSANESEVAGVKKKASGSTVLDKAKGLLASATLSIKGMINRKNDVSETDVVLDKEPPLQLEDSALVDSEISVEDIEGSKNEVKAPPVMGDVSERDDVEKVDKLAEEIKETSAKEYEEKPDSEDHIVEPPKDLPGRNVSVDDFVIAEEVTPAMTVEKSEYKEIVDEAIVEDKKEEAEFTGIVREPVDPPENLRSANYVQEFKAMRSPIARIQRSQWFKRGSVVLSGIIAALWVKILSLFGKEPAQEKKKVFLSNPSSLEPRKIQPGMIIIAVIVLLIVGFRINSNIKQTKLEEGLLVDMKEVVGKFNSYYDQNIAIIDTEDINHQLETCTPTADSVYAKEKLVLPQLKTEEAKSEVQLLADQVRTKVAECEAMYDRINGIVRIKDAELIADFATSLGSDSDISGMDVYNGLIVVTDSGRNAVYQLNIETRNISRFEDPLQLVTNPVALGTGEGILFVCDESNGVLYYSSDATGGKEGFIRIAGSEPASIGECMAIDGYAKNAYVIPTTGNVVYKLQAKKGGGYELPSRYMEGLLGARSLSIDGAIYVSVTVGGIGNVHKYFGGKLDGSFTMAESAEIGEILATYTNPSNDRNLYVYDQTANSILSIEKPNSKRHAGVGIVETTYVLQNDTKFKDVRGVAVDLNGNNQEVNMYILAGSTIWRIKL